MVITTEKFCICQQKDTFLESIGQYKITLSREKEGSFFN